MIFIFVYPDGTAESKRAVSPVSPPGITADMNRAELVLRFDEYSGKTEVVKHRGNFIRQVGPTETTRKVLDDFKQRREELTTIADGNKSDGES
jgi:hypothetical protein